MHYRRFGRLEWQISEVGCGMWGMGGWTGSDDDASRRSRSSGPSSSAATSSTPPSPTGTAGASGSSGSSWAATGKKLYAATKVPPKNRKWPGRPETPLDEVFPYEHIVRVHGKSLDNLGVERIDLQQLHVWSDAWAKDEGGSAPPPT